ncbi:MULTISPECIES: ornithine carbamoyltransferase [unclassified Curtobacterium]|uniref:ornithine carbamoyltransferase n=1 Tax=unclassified Curtobacterium TaxID=257496 RepID=UPI000F4CB6CD|nr:MULTISPECIES: ornithine carbamoyltransferase [unclassified Curtobacterium]ROP60890.1 ornithine carbamoyltransferase [Curtobacterium sp. ZW137]TCK64266.1 ornithine carbamoyltransferase [Curtobacterium sp. PhB136]
MRSLIRLDDWSDSDIAGVFDLADAYRDGRGPVTSGCAVLFFPASSLRTRVTFERGAALMGLQPIVFPETTLDKPEALADVAGYLDAWADIVVARHPDLAVLDGLDSVPSLPVVNAMTDGNHPCEVLSDLYALRLGAELRSLRFLFVGADGNIARAWQEAARAMELDLVQCCPAQVATPGARWTDDLDVAIRSADVVLTDGPGPHAELLAPYRITAALLDAAPSGVRLNPCPPFLRGREVSADALEHPAFVGHAFKASLLPVQQAVMATCLGLG